MEVKTTLCKEFPDPAQDPYGPATNLHRRKIRKVARTAEWYAAEVAWKGSVTVDGALVWVRRRDGAARIRYLTQILS